MKTLPKRFNRNIMNGRRPHKGISTLLKYNVGLDLSSRLLFESKRLTEYHKRVILITLSSTKNHL